MLELVSVREWCGWWCDRMTDPSKFNVYLIMIAHNKNIQHIHSLGLESTIQRAASTARFLLLSHKARSLTINFQLQLLRPFDDVLLEISIAFRNF